MDREAMRHAPNSYEARAQRRGELEAAWRADPRSRIELVQELCRGKRVLHLGCVDHSNEAMQAGGWLHGRIVEVASVCLGVDYERESVDRMRALGFHAICADVTEPPTDELTREAPFDVVWWRAN